MSAVLRALDRWHSAVSIGRYCRKGKSREYLPGLSLVGPYWYLIGGIDTGPSGDAPFAGEIGIVVRWRCPVSGVSFTTSIEPVTERNRHRL